MPTIIRSKGLLSTYGRWVEEYDARLVIPIHGGIELVCNDGHTVYVNKTDLLAAGVQETLDRLHDIARDRHVLRNRLTDTLKGEL